MWRPTKRTLGELPEQNPGKGSSKCGDGPSCRCSRCGRTIGLRVAPRNKHPLRRHQLAVAHFDGVLRVLRYDNLKSAVKQILCGHCREETRRSIVSRSHWWFQSEIRNPFAKGVRANCEALRTQFSPELGAVMTP